MALGQPTLDGGGGGAEVTNTGNTGDIRRDAQSGSLAKGGNVGIWDTMKGGCAGGGGAGCPSGKGGKGAGSVNIGYAGDVGSGGLLIIYAQYYIFGKNSLLSASGANGGNATGVTNLSGSAAAAGGGASGGGSINVFCGSNISYGGSSDIASYINVSGGTGGKGTGAKYNANGGNGGIGSCNVGFASGTYRKYYSNN